MSLSKRFFILSFFLLSLFFLHTETFGDELIFVELRLGRFQLSEEFDLLEREGRVYAPLGWLSDELRIALTAHPDEGEVRGFVIEKENRFCLSIEKGVVLSEGETFLIPQGAVIIGDDDIWIDIRLLEEWLPLRLDYSRADLWLTITPTRPLPLQMRMERARKHEELIAKEAARERLRLIPLKAVTTPSTWLDGFALDYVTSFGYASQDPSLRSSYIISSAFEIAHGDLELILRGDKEDWLKTPPFFTWAHRRPEDALLREVYLGDHMPPPLSLVTGARPKQGVLLSNYPIGIVDSPFEHTFRGTLLPGWEVELYRNDELIAFAYGDETGRFVFADIPLPFGSHTFKKVFYGPLGEMRTEIQHFYLPRILLLPGEVRYRAGVARSPQGLGDDYHQIFAAVEKGISPWISLSAAALNIYNYPAQLHGLSLGRGYLSLGGLLWLDNLILQAVVARDRKEGGQAMGLKGTYFHPRVSFYIDGHYQEDFLSPATSFVGNEPLRSRIEGGLHGRIVKGVSGRLSVEEERFGEELSEVRKRSIYAHLFTRYRKIGLSSSLHHQETRRRDYRAEKTRARLMASSAVGRLHTRLSANYLVTEREWQDYELSASFPVKDMRVGVSYTESLLADVRRVSGNLNIPLKGGTLGLDLFASGRDYGLFLRFSGSFGWDPHTKRLRASREPLTRYGSFLGRVFLDLDGDGRQDEGESGLSGVRLNIGERLTSPPSDKEGIVHLSRLLPYTHHIISVDEASLPDPFFFSKDPALNVMVRPGRTTATAIPILAAGGISGVVTLFRENLPEEGAAGIPLLLLDKEGREVTRTRTEFDGFFYIDKIPPGEYRLILDREKLLALKLEAYPADYDIAIPISIEPIFIDELNFKLIQ